MESQYTEMGRRIKLRRKELKIKQSEMAEALNVSIHRDRETKT